jgi:hypothetical protein
MRYFEPPYASFFAAAAEQTDTASRDASVRPKIHNLILRSNGKITALDIHPDAIQHVRADDKG